MNTNPDSTFADAPRPTAPSSLGFQHPLLSAYGVKLLPLVASHYALLQKIDCPAFRPRETADAQVTFTSDEVLELIFAVVTPPAELRAALRKGREAFTEAAQAAIADRLPFEVVQGLRQPAIEHLAAALESIGAAAS